MGKGDENRETVVSVRVTETFRDMLAEAARLRKVSTSDLVRTALQHLLSTPIGWACEHVNLTSAPGALLTVDCPSGCVMRPVFHRSEVETTTDA